MTLEASKMDTEKIFAVHAMLHLIFHRNKNQHGTSKWWKWLSILKRTTFNLAKSLEIEPSLYTEAKSSLDVHKQYLAVYIMPKCYLAFSTVIADGQFSTLGTVLLAALARLAKATGIDRDLKMLSRIKVASELSPNPRAPQEDVGELICRSESAPVPSGSSAAHGPAGLRTQKKVTKESKSTLDWGFKAHKKKKKRQNAIDDLFAGLL
ncbi:hypothetical protein ASPWEDRAFT_36220 [Aspergillus wentii DTO 134E9]|uniref:RNase MRP protein 1 RNA binding domain-containing protein n=1 Tax=Aspergillus wentii DTO 134E9 TaxID=1073089 RepID=A0A1L9RUG0_ASPWE|nr:uncharacterized protein ASPWEDRAFT_36220 [Aspergillus wentii DTO 134E9]KAI9923543.1 hypothetical protein MW887_008550 [Aspergillus wentii]OJJ38552.1 hypothetical protein ASPWEDRAFT_36220 [Aspergillus wentii DTO 134E9]